MAESFPSKEGPHFHANMPDSVSLSTRVPPDASEEQRGKGAEWGMEWEFGVSRHN